MPQGLEPLKPGKRIRIVSMFRQRCWHVESRYGYLEKAYHFVAYLCQFDSTLARAM